MRLFDALKDSPVACATRLSASESEPNLALKDGDLFKAFHVTGDQFNWSRRKLSLAKKLDDWNPSAERWPS